MNQKIRESHIGIDEAEHIGAFAVDRKALSQCFLLAFEYLLLGRPDAGSPAPVAPDSMRMKDMLLVPNEPLELPALLS